MADEWNPFHLTTQTRSSSRTAFLLLAIFATVTLYLTLHHEPWRDEADSWLVVRDASIATIFTWTRNAGTPALWYILLKPLVWLGLPYQSQALLHLVLAWSAAAVLLLRAPLTATTRILLLGSYYLAYEYSVIARSYILTVLLLFLAAAWHRERFTRPCRYAVVIALMFNANVHGALIASVIATIYLAQWRRWGTRGPAAAAMMIAGAVAAAAQLLTAPDAAYPQVIRTVDLATVRTAIAAAFFPGRSAVTVWAAVGLLLLVLIAVAVRRGEAVIFLGVSTCLLALLYVFVVFGGFRHAGLLLIVAIVAIWLAGDVPRDAISASAALLLNVSLAASVLFAVAMSHADVTMDFSGSREMGRFISSHGLGGREIAAHNVVQAEAVLPWIPQKQLWYAGLGRYGSYMRWNRDEYAAVNVPYPVAVGRAVERFAHAGKPWLLLLDTAMPDPARHGFRLVYATHGRVYRHRDERYWLYEWIGS